MDKCRLVQLDGFELIKRDHLGYCNLLKTNLDEISPKLLGHYEFQMSNVLILEYLHGKNLLEEMQRGDLDSKSVYECIRLIAKIHDAGYLVGDAKLANFVRGSKGKFMPLIGRA